MQVQSRVAMIEIIMEPDFEFGEFDDNDSDYLKLKNILDNSEVSSESSASSCKSEVNNRISDKLEEFEPSSVGLGKGKGDLTIKSPE